MATSQWLMGKTFDTFAPMGPWIVTADEIADPHSLDIWLEIGGERLQSSNTRELIFKIPELIEFISKVVTFETGDVVITGTPAGVGFARKPPRYLRAGRPGFDYRRRNRNPNQFSHRRNLVPSSGGHFYCLYAMHRVGVRRIQSVEVKWL